MLVTLLTGGLISCQPTTPSTLPMPTTTAQSPLPTNNLDSSKTILALSIDHMLVHDLFEGAVLIGKYNAWYYYGSPDEAFSLLCCQRTENLDAEANTRDASWVSKFEMDALYPLSLVPDNLERLSNVDIEHGNLVFLRKARLWQTEDSLLAIENGKSYYNYLILSPTKDGWRIAQIDTAYPTENLLGNMSPDATATAQISSPSVYLETVASDPDTYLSLAKVSGFLTRVDLRLQGINNKTKLHNQDFGDSQTDFIEQLKKPDRVIVEQLLPLPFTESGLTMTSTDIQEHHVVIEAKLSVDGDPMVWYFTLEHSKDGLQIVRIAQDYP